MSQPPSARLRHLDGLRGIAILLVLVHHFVIPLLGEKIGSIGAYVTAALTLTYTGVDLFFVLSGYLIGGILLDHRDSPSLFTVFYVRRAMRILPLAMLCVFVLLTAQRAGLYGPPDGGAPWPMAVYLFFVTNLWMAAGGDWGYRPLSPLWSLGIEEQFYLVAPWLIRFVPRARTHWLLLAFALLAPFARLMLIATGRDFAFAASMLPFGRMDSLGLGMLAAWLVRSPAAGAWFRQRRAFLPGLIILAGLGCATLTKLRAGNASSIMAAWGYSVVAVFYAGLLLFGEIRRDSRLNRVLSITPLVLLGRYSYFLYLFQGFAIGLVVGIVFHARLMITNAESWPQLAVGFAGLLALAALSWHWLESPLIALGRRRTY